MPPCCGFCRRSLGDAAGQRAWENDGECEWCQVPICDECWDSDEYLDGFQVSPYPGEYLCYPCQARVKDCPVCYGYLTERMGKRSEQFKEPCPVFPHKSF